MKLVRIQVDDSLQEVSPLLVQEQAAYLEVDQVESELADSIGHAGLVPIELPVALIELLAAF